MDKLRKEFLDPPLTFRGAPFWSWNDRLRVDELTRQVKDMKAHGMGGFFMHSREGLETTYMGPEWMECIRETVKVAQETGMNAWLYDEDRWPSGFAGGLVPARGGDAFRAKMVTVEERSDLPEDSREALAVFAGKVKDETLSALRRVDLQKDSLRKGEVYLVLRREIAQGIEWFNDDAYADNLNPDSVAAFLDITYEAYAKAVGKSFGGAVPGIFTDEPNLMSHRTVSKRRMLPWTDGLPEMFRQRRGYDLLDGLPWLFYDGERAAKVRHDYWYTISQRFAEAYSKQIGEWCEKHGLAYTGHFLNENEMGYHILRGGAVMPHYRYQQVPGIDMLMEQNHEFLTIKQCSSVANQFGRSRVLSETYGCSGWEFTFEGQKWNGDWQYVLGVNLRCQHLALYSLRGCRKRDYPPAFNYNTTWWKYNGVVEDYFARIGRVLSEGSATRDVLLIHPIATGWMMQGEGDARVEQANAYSERLNDFVRALLATHYDFDFGDEQILASDGKVAGSQVMVGRAPYALVIVPPGTQTLLASTVGLLERYLAAGGKVIAFEPLPMLIEAEPAEKMAKLWGKPGVNVLADASALNATLEATLARRVSLLTPHGQQAAHLLTMQRDLGGGRYAYFIVNNDRQNGTPVEAALQGSGRLEEWDPLTGEVRPLDIRAEQGMFRFPTYFAPAGSRLYVVEPGGNPARAGSQGFQQTESWERARRESSSYIGPVCSFTRTDPNLLTLDMCQYRMGEGEWSEWTDVWRAQDAIRKALGMRSNYYNGLPQRYRWALEPHPQDGAPVALRFTFSVRDIPQKPVFLLLEGADWFEIRLNGKRVANTPAGWYLDQAFHKIALPGLKAGENELVLSCKYRNYYELEDCYLLGDFGVSLERAVIAEPQKLHFGEWAGQGYPHYAGSMIYHGSVEYEPGKAARVFLGEHRAVDVAIWINGKLAGHIPWRAANGLDITALLKEGANQVDIEVVSSPRNMLGPLHRAAEHEPWTDWSSFRRSGAAYTADYVYWPWGLIGQVRVVQK